MVEFLIVLFAVVVSIIAIAGVLIPVVWYKDLKMLMDKEVNAKLDQLDRERA